MKMAGRRKGERKLVIEKPDLDALFLDTARQIYLRGCTLDAYRRASGFYVKWNRSEMAKETFELEVSRCTRAFNHIGSVSDAHDHAARWAMKSFLGNWWSHTLTNIPPVQFGEGDEFYNKHTVVAIVEEWRDFIPDRRG
ncbi:MAG: hypothetical protein EOO15_16760 [Chitinophagaceae bacterium]|nr:MAG: hypothetical protein EOO15_16760 [Chitinophagaceae bacterium]